MKSATVDLAADTVSLLLLMLLLRYRRRLRMISELHVKGGRDSRYHSWCICVVSHCYVGWVWRWWMVCMRDKAKRVGRMSGDAGALRICEVLHLLRKCELKKLMTSGHTAFQVHSSW